MEEVISSSAAVTRQTSASTVSALENASTLTKPPPRPAREGLTHAHGSGHVAKGTC